MKFYTLAASSLALAGSAVADLSVDTCFANPLNDQLFDLWNTAVVQKGLTSSLDTCHSYAFSGLQTTVHNAVWQRLQNTLVVDIQNPDPEELVPLKLTLSNVLTNLFDLWLDTQSTVDLLTILNQIERDTLGLVTHMIEDVMHSIGNAENVNWNADDVTPREFLEAALAVWQSIIGDLTAEHLAHLAVQAIEIVEPTADYVSSLLQNPERLESLANALIQTVGGLGHMIYEWGTVQEQVNDQIFDDTYEDYQNGMAYLQEELSDVIQDGKNIAATVRLAGPIIGNFLDTKNLPEPDRDPRFNQALVKVMGSELFQNLASWVQTCEFLYSDLENPIDNAYDYGYNSTAVVDMGEKLAVLEDFGEDMIATFMNKEALLAYRFQVDHVLEPLYTVFGQETITAIINHLSTVDTLPDMAKAFVQSNEVRGVINWFLDVLQAPEVLEGTLDMSDDVIFQLQRWYRHILTENWSNKFFQSMINFRQFLIDLDQCEEVCRNKF